MNKQAKFREMKINTYKYSENKEKEADIEQYVW